MRFRHGLACAALIAFVSMGARPAGAVLGAGEWSPPVSGPVVRGFDPPATRFGPGHLGIDYAVAPGTPVRAAGDGVVTFAGRVGAGLFVVTRHPGDIRSTDSFLATIAVVAGEVVQRGAIVGTSGGTGPGHRAGVLHFGVRVGAVDVDPMLLFAPPDLAAVVHLAAPHGGPTGATGPASADEPERAAIADELRVDARVAAPQPPSWWNDVVAAPAEPQPGAGRAAQPAPPLTRSGGTRSAGTRTVPVAAAVGAAGLAGIGVRNRRATRKAPTRNRGLRGL